jgi:uncharacterized protein
MLIFWHHLGREHGLGEYTADLRKNSAEVVNAYLDVKIRGAKENRAARRFVQIDADTLLELPAEGAPEQFLICYRPREGLQYSLSHKRSARAWLVDIVEVVEFSPDTYSSRDLFLDIEVEPSGAYRVLDVDDFRQAIELGLLDTATILRALASLDLALAQLHSRQFPPAWLGKLVDEHAPALSSSEGIA